MLTLAEDLNVPGAPRHPGAPDLSPTLAHLPGAREPLAPVEPPTPRVAVLLNARARKVTPRVLRALSHVVPRSDLFLSRSPMDARRIAHTILPVAKKGDSDWGYAGIPIAGPLIGGALAGALLRMIA